MAGLQGKSDTGIESSKDQSLVSRRQNEHGESLTESIILKPAPLGPCIRKGSPARSSMPINVSVLLNAILTTATPPRSSASAASQRRRGLMQSQGCQRRASVVTAPVGTRPDHKGVVCRRFGSGKRFLPEKSDFWTSNSEA